MIYRVDVEEELFDFIAERPCSTDRDFEGALTDLLNKECYFETEEEATAFVNKASEIFAVEDVMTYNADESPIERKRMIKGLFEEYKEYFEIIKERD